MNAAADVADERLFDNWFDPIETALRTKVRGFIETLVEEELETALARPRYGRRAEPAEADNPDEPMVGHRHGHRMRSLTRDIRPDRYRRPARPDHRERRQDDGMEEQGAAFLPASHARRDALIASTYLSGTNTRRMRRALAALFGGAVGKDVVSRVWRKVKILWGRAAVKDRVSFGLLLKPKGPRHATD